MALLKRKRSGLGDAMEVVTKFVNACNRHDADGVYACLHPDFDSIQPMYPSRNFRGADQVRRNWQAIFDAEPGFRLTVLRSAAADDTIWLELHGAGQDAEVAGVFVMGIQGDRIRWARIYSALVEPVPEGVGEPPAPLREVSRQDQPAAAGSAVVVEEALIAPVLDMDRGGRRRRRRRGEAGEGAVARDEAAGADAEDATAVISGNADMETAVVVGGDDEVAVVVEGDDEVAVAVVADPEVDVAVATDADVVVVSDEPDPEPQVLVAGPADDDGGPATEAVDMVTITTDEPGDAAEPEATSAGDEDDDQHRRGFFRKRP